MRAQNELLDAIQVLIDKSLKDKATKVTGGKVKSASGGRAIITINGYDYPIPYSGDAPKIGSTVRVFIPNGNMSDAFIGGGGGGGSTGTTNYNNLTNKPSINGVTLSGNKTSTELGVYGTGNEPPYPVTSVNGQTGDVTVQSGSEAASYTATLTTSGWAQSGNRYAQTVNVAGVTASTPVVLVDVALSGTDLDADAAALEAWGIVSANNVAQGDGTLTFYAMSVPSVNVPVNVGVC